MASQRRVAVRMEIDQVYKRHTEVFAGIHEYATQQDHWRLIIDEWADYTLPAEGGEPAPYDGLIGRISAQGARRARRLGLPVVSVWFNSPARDLPGVFPDVDACGRLPAEHLLARGFRSFGAVCRRSYRFSERQADAFEKAVKKAGCDHFRNVIVPREYNSTRRDWNRSIQAFERWLDTLRLPVGLWIYDISTARVIIEMCRGRGWRVPEEVAIVAGLNEEILCERPEPSISSIEVPYKQIGLEAARMLDRLMDEREKERKKGSGVFCAKHPKGRSGKRLLTPFSEPETLLLPPVGIVARRSTDFHAVDDPVVRRALRFIDENMGRQIKIDELAQAAGVSRRTLTNRFRDKMHRSVAAEIQRLRIERVKRELTTTDETIRQIAIQAGFGSPRTLNDAFKSEVGCTPREYRKQWSPASRNG